MRAEMRLRPNQYRWIIGFCLAMTLAGSAVGIALPAGLGWDFANFYDTGRRVVAGELVNLYRDDTLIGGQPPQGSMQFYGVPLSAYFYVPLTMFSPLTASRLFKLQGFVALAISLWLIYRHAGRLVTPTEEMRWKFAACYAGLVLLYQPFWTIYRVGGQTTPTVFLLFTVAMLSYLGQRITWTAVLLTLVILIKPAFVLPCGLLAVVSGVPMCLAMTLWGALAALASLLLAGIVCHREFLELMLKSANTSVGWIYNSAATVAVENLRLLSDPHPMRAQRPLGLTRVVNGLRLLIGLLFLAWAWRGRRLHAFAAPGAQRLLVFLSSLVFGMGLMPIVWEHYLSVLFLPLIYLLAISDSLPKGARVLTVTAFGLAAVQNLVVVQWLHAHWSMSTPADAMLSGLLKGGPLLLTIWLLVYYHRRLCVVFDDRWARVAESL